MVVNLTPQLEVALAEQARKRGVAPEVLALDVLQERFLGASSALQPQDDWERSLLAIAKDCGVSLPNAAVSSEGIYE